MDQRPRTPDLAKDDYIDRYQDGRGFGITALLLGFAALLIAGWLLLSTRVDPSQVNTAENGASSVTPAYRAPAAPQPTTPSQNSTPAAPQSPAPATKP
jgi:hypothetical protein